MRHPLAVALWVGQIGCYSANRYDVPDTMPQGNYRFTAALEAARVSRERTDPRFGSATEKHEHLALVPNVVGRYAVAEGFELGVTLGPTRSTAEAKVRLLDGLALAPGGGLSGGIVLLDVPLLARARLHERVSLVMAPGVAFAKALGQPDDIQPAGWLLRAGFGLRVRVTEAFAIMPEVTTMTSTGSPAVNWTTVGLGFQLGSPL